MNDFTLIANSGIQFLVQKISISSESNSKILFHEWFDEEAVEHNLEFAYNLKDSQRVVRLADLQDCDFIDDSGKLKVTEKEILSNPNIKSLYVGDVKDAEGIFSMKLGDKNCKVMQLLNQWLPIPYFELDLLDDFKDGPYNWCRCKIIPCGSVDGDGFDAYMLLAFDTHATYGEYDDYSECPVFESETEIEKRFKFCASASKLLSFCSGKNDWVRTYLMNTVHGVSELESIPVNENKGEYKYAFLASYLWLVDYIANNVALPTVKLERDRDVQNIGVEMMIDIGNSRTAAVLFEDDFTKVQPLTLFNFSDPLRPDGTLNRTQESFDMRVAFQKVDFGEKTMVGSRQFVWPSIVRLGDEAQQLTHQTTNLATGDEIFSTYSSPKRYLWDNKARKEEWRCVKLTPDGKNEIPSLEGISNFFQDNGEVDKDELGYGYHYSRKSLMTLAFMEIIAQANVQINSSEYRTFRGKTRTARYLDKIIMTCPTGMSKNEQKALHDCLKDALYVLNHYYRNNDESYAPYEVQIIPQVGDETQWMFDEATCSQFVYLYGQLTETYQNCTEEFFKLYGKKRDGNNYSLNIGSLDIGAGTSDIMVCEYEYDKVNASRLKPIPKFWDSFDTAGDDMLRMLIANVLLQGQDGILEQYLLENHWEKDTVRRTLYNFFGQDHTQMSFEDRILRRDFNLQVLVPIMYKFLQLLSDGETYYELTYSMIFKGNAPSNAVLQKFKETFKIDLSDIVWKYRSEILSTHIKRVMDGLLTKVATILYSYDCDIILLSGRPTSLLPIKETFLKNMPVFSPDRLILLNKHRVGRWFPFVNEFGYLNNSKSVVPVGAMIGYLASSAGGYNNFSLDLSELASKIKPTTDYFIVNDNHVQLNKCFITPTQIRGEIISNSFPLYIGSKQFDLSQYPVRPFYVLDFNEDKMIERIKEHNPTRTLTPHDIQYMLGVEKANILHDSPLTFTIEREDYKDNKEILLIDTITNQAGDEVNPSNFALSIQSLNDPDCYWLDSGVFDINIQG